MKLQTLVFSALACAPFFTAFADTTPPPPSPPPLGPAKPVINPDLIPKGYVLQSPDAGSKIAPGAVAGTIKHKDATVEHTTDMPNPQVLFLTGLPLNGTAEELATYLLHARVSAEESFDPVLRHVVRITLAKIEGSPKDAAAIRADHLKRLAAYFYTISLEARKTKNTAAENKAILIAVRCNPAHINARKRLAEVIAATGQYTRAINTLAVGLRNIKLDDPDAIGYVQDYFTLLDATKSDREIIRVARELLRRSPALPASLRSALALKAAVASNWIGDYEGARTFIRENALNSFSARMSEARASFYGGDTAGAVRLLYDAAPRYRGQERDALLAQIVRFYAETGKWESALSIAKQRITEFPTNPQARVLRLWLLEMAGKRAEFERETQVLLDRYADDDSVLSPIGMLASERAMPALVEKCRRLHVSIPGKTTKSPDLFDSLYVEALIRAKLPQAAIDACQRRKLTEPDFVKSNEGTTNALLAAAYFQDGDTATARRYIEAFLVEGPDDASQARIRELMARRDGMPDAEGKSTTPVPLKNEMRSINEEILRLTDQPRVISENTYLAVGKLLRFVNAPQDALRVLEQGRRAYPASSQLKADSISARIALKLPAKSEQYKGLLTDIESLLTMRRPNPRIWAEISRWLTENPTLASDPKNANLRPAIAKLVRPDLYISGLF